MPRFTTKNFQANISLVIKISSTAFSADYTRMGNVCHLKLRGIKNCP